MARYAVGDLQGCLGPLQRLLGRIRFDPERDQLWLVGDLVARGPHSLNTLRFVRSLGSAVIAVLGNHDLHLLAVAHGVRKLSRADRLEQVLEAHDAPELMEWLAARPLMHRDAGTQLTLVHAGLAPQWDIEQAQVLADEVAAALQGPDRITYLQAMYGNHPDRWSPGLSGMERLRVITNYFTRLRFCDPEGRLELEAKGPPEQPPEGCMPWFAVPDARWRGETLVFGHWAALNGRTSDPRLIALDTGCVWGNCMTLIDLDSRMLYQQSCA